MTDHTLSHLSGAGEGRLYFEEIDQRYQLKIRAFIRLCMPSVFGAMERELDLRSLREEGTIPVMFFLQFESDPKPLAFAGRVETPFKVRLCESGREGGQGDEARRLLVDMQIDVNAQEGSGDPKALGGGPRSRKFIPAGRMRGVHVLTRPVAPPDQRRITEVPPQLQGMQVHRWEEPFPSVEGLHVPPEDCEERDAGAWTEHRSVWGLQNTDINQHINVHEYILAMENHFTRMLFGAGLDAGGHRIARTSILFRKPFFSGEPHGLRGRLFVTGDRTVMLGSIHRIDPEGGFDPRASIAARMEGSLGGDR